MAGRPRCVFNPSTCAGKHASSSSYSGSTITWPGDVMSQARNWSNARRFKSYEPARPTDKNRSPSARSGNGGPGRKPSATAKPSMPVQHCHIARISISLTGFAVALHRLDGTVSRFEEAAEGRSPPRLMLLAALRALRECLGTAHLRVTGGDQYLVRGVKEWLSGWKSAAWRRKDGKPLANADLWW